MNEEQKEAIEYLKTRLYGNEGCKYIDVAQEDLRIFINLIDSLQKENEELKQERYNNNQMIALAQNEVLGYMQGYEDGKKLNRSAVACVVENQQYYIIKKEIEHYKEYIEKLQKENEKLKEENEYNKLLLDTNKNFTIDKKNGNYKWNVIEIQKIKDKIEEYKNILKTCNEAKDVDRIKAINERVLELEELLDSNDTNVGSI